jgi:hypothetical protein
MRLCRSFLLESDMSKKQTSKSNVESRTRLSRTTPKQQKGATREPKLVRGQLPVGKYATHTAPQVPATAFTHTFVQPQKQHRPCYIIHTLPQNETHVTVRFADGSNQVVARNSLRETGGAA